MRRDERGAAALEFALLLPVLVILVFGIIDFGQLLNAQITLSQAARVGARLAALGDSSACSKTAAAATGLGLSCPSSAIAVTSCAAGATQTSNGSVVATYTFTFSNPLASVVGSPTLVLTGKSYMPCGG